jgi:hypothetical protein
MPSPTNRRELLLWCQAHVEPFRNHAEAVGLQEEQVTRFADRTEEFALALAEVERIKIALSLAVRNADSAFGAMRREYSQAVADVRYFAGQQDDAQAVYNLAQVQPRSSGQALPPPGRPQNLSVTLNETQGSLTLAWKCTHPRGGSSVAYIVRRRLPGEDAFAFLATTGEKHVQDTTLPAGNISGVAYTVQAQRGRVMGEASSIFVVNVGSGADVSRITTRTRAA